MLEPDEGWMAALSPSSRETADAVALKRTMRLDLVALVTAWVSSVEVIARVTGDKYYEDYACYLGWREILDEVMAAVSEADATVIRRAVERADAAFREHTVDDAGAALSRKMRIDTERWYWRRVPVDGPIARSLGIGTT